MGAGGGGVRLCWGWPAGLSYIDLILRVYRNGMQHSRCTIAVLKHFCFAELPVLKAHNIKEARRHVFFALMSYAFGIFSGSNLGSRAQSTPV